MVLKLLESWDDGLWSSRVTGMNAAGVGSSYGKNGNGARLGDTPGYGATFTVANPCVVGFDFKVVSASGDEILFSIGNSDSDEYCVLKYDATNERLHFQFYNGTTNYKHAYSGSGSVPTGEWHFVEMKIFQSTSSVSTLSWALDGSSLTSITNGDVVAVRTTGRLGGNGFKQVLDWYSDNLYYCDTTGGVNDDLLGPTRVIDIYPSGNGNSSNMTGSDGNSTDNYLLVDETGTPDDDTTYVESDTEGDKDTYAMDNLTPTGAVSGVIVNLWAKKDTAETRFMRPVVRTSSTDYAGTSVALGTSYALVSEAWDENPNTTSAWTTSEIDGIEVGQEVRDS